jgi:hypothetical protein
MALIIAAAGASLLILQWAGGRPLWLDEEMIAINFRDRTLRGLASPLWLDQSAPYGWLVLQRLIVTAFGAGERAVRFVPLSFGVATLGTAAWIGRRSMGPAGAVVLALLCATGEWLSFYVLELKHYSADVCFAMLLPALAGWVTEAPQADRRALRKRVLVFWTVAATAQWLANGALFVTPACAVIIVALLARRFGWRAGVEAASFGVVWLASFALNDAVSLEPARTSQALQGAWAAAFPPAGAGASDVLRWLGERLTPLALKPGGSGFGGAFWIVTIAGLAFGVGQSPARWLMFASVPLSAFVLAAVRIVPLSDRLSLWIVPALYVGIALSAERASALFRPVDAHRTLRVAAGSAASLLLIAICADVMVRGTTYLHLRPQTSNHGLDDRSAVRWLAGQRQAGDVWVTTHLALPAIWWYGAEIGNAPLYEASFVATAPGSADCGVEDVHAVLKNGGRALLYLGFRFDDVPRGFDDLLLLRLGEIGEVTRYRGFGDVGHAMVIDMRHRSKAPLTLASLLGPLGTPASASLDGCIAVRPAKRW